MLLRPCSASIARRTSERSHARAPCAAAAAPAPALLAACRAAAAPCGAIRPRAAGVHVRRQRIVCSAAALPLAGGAAEPGAAAAEPLSAMLKYYAAFLVFGCAVNTIGPMLPSLAAHVGLTPVQMAPLLTAKGLGGLAGSFLCPLLPLAYLMPGGLLAISASFATIPVVTSLAQLALVYSFAAAVYQAVSIAAHTLIAQQHGDRAGPHLNGINALFGAGSLLAPVVHRTLSPAVAHISPLASYWVISAAALLVAVPFFRSGAVAKTSGAPATAHAAEAAPAAWGRDEVLVVVAAMALVACNVGAENCFGTWLYTYAVQSAALGPAVAATAVSLFWGAFTAGRLLAIPASARLAPGVILLASLPLAVLGPTLALLGRGSPAMLYAAAVAAGLGISTGFANSVSLLARYVLPTGKVQALIQLAATAGSMTFPPAVAIIAQRGVLGVEAFLWVAAACAAADIMLVLLVQSTGGRVLKARAALKLA